MPITVSLREVVGELEIVPDEYTVYINIQSGELVGVGPDEMRAAESAEDLDQFPEWRRQAVMTAKEILSTAYYLPLPSRFDIHEWEIMRQFCLAMENEDVSQDLLHAINGSGAFRRFGMLIDRYGLEQEWHRFYQQALTDIATEWLEDNGIAYTRDMEPGES